MRLIDANGLKKELLRLGFSPAIVVSAIDRMPTVDAVPVVRCKECKHNHEETAWCTVHSHFVDQYGMACSPSESSDWKMFDGDYFCKDGEREDKAK